MPIVLIIILATIVNVWLWLRYKKYADNYKLIAQEWRETAQALKDESETNKTLLAQKFRASNKQLLLSELLHRKTIKTIKAFNKKISNA